jgi:hypothetical protein
MTEEGLFLVGVMIGILLYVGAKIFLGLGRLLLLGLNL